MRVGNIILALMVVLWFLSSFPGAPEGATGPAIQYSYAGMLGQALEVIFAPIGFNWQISIALVPGMAAREVAVGALGTVYALSATGDDVAGQLAPMLAAGWSLPTAFSLLAWYVFSPQCLSTLAVVKRETNSWRYPLLMAGYLFALALAYRVALDAAFVYLGARFSLAALGHHGARPGLCESRSRGGGATPTTRRGPLKKRLWRLQRLRRQTRTTPHHGG
jgi:ferrous iron transport protein B